MVRTRNLPRDTSHHINDSKLANPFTGPFEIKEAINDVTYKVDLPDYLRVHPVFHVS